MEMEPDIENMTMSEYLEYEAAKERRLWDDVRSRRSSTKRVLTLFIGIRVRLLAICTLITKLHPCFLPVQSYPKNYSVSTNESNDVYIENMTIAEYNLYVAKQFLGMNPLSNDSYGFTPQFFAQPQHTPNTSKKDSDFDKILDDLFRTGAENMERMGHDIVQDSIWEQNDDSDEDQEEDGDDGDTFDMWNITVEDVERIRRFFNVPDEIDEIVQPVIPEPIHTTPPNDDYVAPATKLNLNKLLEELCDEILNVAMIDEEANFNPTKDLEELERLLAFRPQSNFTKIQVHLVIINTMLFIHTQLMSPLYGVFKTSKPCKVDRDIISPGRYAFYSSFPYLVAYLHSQGVYCYFNPHLIPGEGMNT
nr:phytochrome B [Tanacetum cinerariifolium]